MMCTVMPMKILVTNSGNHPPKLYSKNILISQFHAFVTSIFRKQQDIVNQKTISHSVLAD